jgi:hypothetical protein
MVLSDVVGGQHDLRRERSHECDTAVIVQIEKNRLSTTDPPTPPSPVPTKQ